MAFKSTLEAVESSEIFQNFLKENPDAELCAGFFIIDFVSNDNKKSIDYKTSDKIFTFDLRDDGRVMISEDKLISLENCKFPKLEKIDREIKIEVDELKGIAGVRALDEGISAKLNKIIAVLQKYNNRQIWNLTCMLDGLIILNILIDSNSGEIIKFERKSMMDLVRKK